MLCGTTMLTLDSKNRVVVPRKIQAQLTTTAQGRISGYLSLGEDRCLYLYSETAFERANQQLETQPFTGEKQRAAKRIFLAFSQPVELDTSGRILIPEEMRAKAGIEKDVVMLGNGDRAELWSLAAWKEYQARHEDVLTELDRVGARATPPAVDLG